MTTFDNIRVRCENYAYDDINLEYFSVFGDCLDPDPILRIANEQKSVSFRLPCRLSSPMISLPPEIKGYCSLGFPKEYRGLNQMTLDSLYLLGATFKDKYPEAYGRHWRFFTDMDSLLNASTSLSRLFSKTPGFQSAQMERITERITNWLTEIDLSGMMMKGELDNPLLTSGISTPPLVSLIMRVRAIATRMYGRHRGLAMEEESEEYGLKLMLSPMGQIIFNVKYSEDVISLILSDRFAMIVDEQKCEVIVVGMSYIDYVFTREEIKHNLDIIGRTQDYRHLTKLFSFLKRAVEASDKHDLVVDFMKSYEGFLNMTADFKADHRCSIGSYMDVINSMIAADKLISGISVRLEDVLKVLFGSDAESQSMNPILAHSSYILSLSFAIRSLSPVNLLEASSLHKLCFYAVIDEKKGFLKFCKRTHTPRESDPRHIELMRSFFNRQYITSYLKKHDRLPPILSSDSGLAIADVVPQLSKTEQSDVEHKVSELNKEMKREGHINSKGRPLMWWYNLRPYNSESTALTESPIEQAKDKRSATTKGSYSLEDSEKELETIIRSPDFSYISIVGNPEISSATPTARIINQGSEHYDSDLTAVMKEKEREQKGEGRLFGMFTTAGKQSLSLLMRKAENVLSYFDGNLMTPSDKQRKMKLHWMAQTLLDDDTYAILADVEGHNQSMQFSNSGDLIESIGLCYGEFGWSSLANLFGSLNLFYATFYSDYAYVSSGQLGGIEGWYNPVWTLHTLIITKLLGELTDLEQRSEAVYSDDIAVVARITIHDDDTLNRILRTVQSHYLKFGMVLKALQTVVSKTRITMLRQHYTCGQRADSALKRMVAVSGMGSSTFHSDELEASGISSAISSSVELSNSIYAQCVLKWRRCTELLLRPFISAMSTKLDEYFLDESMLSPRTISLYRSMYHYNGGDGIEWIRNSLKSILSNVDKQNWAGYLERMYSGMSKQALSSSQLSKFKDDLLHCLLEDDGLYTFFLLRCVAPQDLGGCGILLHEMMILTGVRDSVGRLYGALLSYLKPKPRCFRVLCLSLEFALGGNGRLVKQSIDTINRPFDYMPVRTDKGLMYYNVEYSKETLVTQDWPNAQRSPTINDMLKKTLRDYFTRICRNAELLNLLEYEQKRSKYKELIMEELSGSFYQKIASFYLDCSVFMIIDKLLGKVENTSSLIRKSKGYKDICSQASSIGLTAFRRWTKRPVFTFGEINEGTMIHSYLFERRSEMFPSVNFLEVIEPEANQSLYFLSESQTDQRLNDWMFHMVHSPGMSHEDGMMRFLPPVYGSEALYKGALKDPDASFSHLREALLVKAVSVTKWILYRSDPSQYSVNLASDNNVKNCANLSISTLGYEGFMEYEAYVPLVTRSEVAHRIPILDVKPKAAIRSLPSFSTRFRVVYNQRRVHALKLEDSNIHFDYMKLRLILANAASLSCRQMPLMNSVYGMKMTTLIRDVQFDFLLKREKIDVSLFTIGTLPIKYRLDKVRIRWLSRNLEPILLDGEIPIPPAIVNIGEELNTYEELNNVLIYDYYLTIKRQNLWDLNPLWSLEAWLPFRKQYESLLPSNDAEFSSLVVQVISDRANSMIIRAKKGYHMTVDDHAFLALKRAYVEQNASTSDDFDSILGTVQENLNLISSMKGGGTLSKDDIRAALSSLGSSRKQFILRLLSEVLLSDCIICRWDGGRCVVDEIQSRLLFESLSEVIASKVKIDESQKILLNLLHHTLSESELVEYFTNLLAALSSIALEMPLEIDVDESILLKTKYEDANSGPLLANPPEMNLICHMYNVVGSSSEQLEKIAKANLLRQRYIDRFGLPDVFCGPYASDVYQSGLSIMRKLRDLGIIRTNEGVLDFVSGRGEFAAAMDKCGISRISYSRKDIYVCTRHHDSITFLEDYDWAGNVLPDIVPVEVLAKADSHPLSLVDVSHLGKGKDPFSDRFMDLLILGGMCMTRLSSISGRLTEVHELIRERGGSFALIYVGSELMQMPLVYAICTVNPGYSERFRSFPKSPECISHILSDLGSLFKLESSAVLNDGPLTTSVISDLIGEEQIDSRISSIVSSISDSSSNRHLLYLSSKSNRLGMMPVLKVAFEELSNLLHDGQDELVVLRESYRSYYNRSAVKLSREEAMKFDKYMDYDKSYYVDVNKAKSESLFYLRRRHPVAMWRSICNSILNLSISAEFRGSSTLNEIVSRRLGIMDTNLRIGNPRSMNLFESFLLLAGDVIMGSPNMHRSILLSAHRSRVINSKRMSDLFYYRKMISGLYPYVSRFFNIWSNMDAYSYQIREAIINRYLRPSLFSKEKLYTLGFMKGRKERGVMSSSEEESRMRDMFMNSIDAMFDLEVFSGGFAQATELVMPKSDLELDTLYIEKVGSLFDGFKMDMVEMGMKLTDTVIDSEAAKYEELKHTLLRDNDEKVEDFERRAQMIAMMSQMYDDYFEED